MNQQTYSEWSVSTFEQKVVVESDEYVTAFDSIQAKELAQFGILGVARTPEDVSIPYEVQQEVAERIDRLRTYPSIDWK
jgi:hypothetical protein